MYRFMKHSSLSACFSGGERREFGITFVVLENRFFISLLMAVGGFVVALAK